jgi:anaphase-promoting complex subunit 11
MKSRTLLLSIMKVTYTSIHPVATWKWDTSSDPHYLWRVATDAPVASSSTLPKELFKFGEVDDDDDEDDDVCGICRLAYEACCPTCKVPGDDCPLSKSLQQCALNKSVWGECKHIFHMHCLLKWLETESSKQACPMDRRPWGTNDQGIKDR